MSYVLHLLIFFDIYVIVALSLNMMVGYGGLLTLAHAAYFAVGGYVYALATLVLGWGFIPAILLSLCITAFLSLALSLPAWRFSGLFFLIISLAVQALLFSLFYAWFEPGAEVGTWANLTNGPYGLAGVPKPAFGGIKIDSIAGVAGVASAVALACVGISWLVLVSPWGRMLKSIRDDELAARGLGKNVRLAKVHVCAVACAMVALAGALYVAYVGYIDPQSASLDESILFLCFVLVGGVGNLRGPLLGALILLAIPEALRLLDLSDALAAEVRLMAYGLLLVLMVHLRPQGIAGEYRLE